MTPKERAENYARAFPKYPRLRYDDRWLDGFWVLGQDYRGSGLHGSYPPGFLKRIRAIFPNEFQGRVLHLFSGSLGKEAGGFRIDISKERDPPPDVYGDAQRLPFRENYFDLIIADPPYTSLDAEKYGTKMVNRATVFREVARILKPGGQLVWLDARSPMHRKKQWHWWGIIGLSRSTNHIYRAVTFYERRESVMSKALKRIEAASQHLTSALAILLGVDAESVHEAVEDQKANTKTREKGTDDEEEAAPKKKRGRPAKLKPPVEDDEDEGEAPAKKKSTADDEDDEDETTEDDAEDIPKDSVLDDLDRTGLKKIAVANGLDPAGKNYEDLKQMLKDARDKGKKKPAKEKTKPAADDDEDDDEDEDEAPAKKKSKAAKAEDEPDEDDYPSVKEQKRDLEAFFKLNKETLKKMGFFGGKPAKGVTPAPNTYDEVMGDKDLIKEAWKDNIWEHVQAGTWEKQKAKAAKIDDDEDDE